MRLIRRTVPLLLPMALTVLLISSASSGATATQEQTPTREDVQTALEEAVAAGVPGIALAIRSPEGGEFLAAGDASLKQQRPLRPEDRFRIASVTKAFTAAAVMDLIEEGKLSLDDTVEKWVPGLLAKGDSITVRNLLGHTSGLPEYTKDEKFLKAFTSGEDLSPRDIVSFVSSEPLVFEPGTNYEYSDTDNIVLGLIIEAATGRSYEEELRSRILEPLGLQATILPHSPEMPDAHAQGYQYDPEGDATGKPDDVTSALNPDAAWASGALISTPGDVSRFFSALLGRELVGEEALEQMKKTVAGEGSPPGPGIKHAGLGIFSYELPCGEVWGHTGQFPGYQAFGAATPDGRAALAMMVNATDISEQADEAVVHAQQLAACRALGISATAGNSTTLGGSLVPSGGPPLVLAAVLATAVVVVGASALSFLVLRERM
jgi:D-alanyl-D-alanine carboxypeptidase